MAINRHILQLLHLTYEAFYMKIHSIAFVIIRKRHFLSYVSQDVFAQYWPHVWLTVIVWYKNAHRDSELYVICTIWNRMFCHIAVSTGLSMWHCYYYYYFVIAVSTGLSMWHCYYYYYYLSLLLVQEMVKWLYCGIYVDLIFSFQQILIKPLKSFIFEVWPYKERQLMVMNIQSQS